MDWRTHIVTDPKILAGKPIVKGTRLAVEHVIALLASGWTIEQVVAEHAGLTKEHVLACLAYASDRLSDDRVYPLTA
ncbi:MAG: DUF433 domain-containing protein [Phycisphaerales bacterium]